uniref:Enoyl reductase (ER) domain-containing protein n=1 Tax=Oryza barthii TaxID=65489 RepID=A0A0D3FBT2_9ORYZ
MRAVVIARAGGPEVLEERDVGEGLPPPGEGEVLVGVSAAGVNRADTVQRQGRYPAPPGASPYPGLECSGTILALGPNIHGGSSGIGTFAIQIAKHLGIKVFVTAGSEEKLAACKGLGADVCINYKTEDFVARVKEETNGKVTLDMEVYLPGVDVILDNIGGLYLQRNLNSLAVDGRLFIIGFQGGAVTEVNLQPMLARRLTIQAAGLRNRSLDNKALIVSEVEKNVWPAVVQGKVKPVIYKTFPLSEAAEAHKLMEESSHIGKILLIP